MNDRTILGSSRARVAPCVAALICALSFSPLNAYLGASESWAQGCPDEDSPAAIDQMMDNPEAYVGCRVVVQGTLYRIQGVDQILYSIKLESGRSLDVWAWAPDESAPTRTREEPEEDGRSMPSYVGQELRIEGKLVRERRGRVVLEASIVEELSGKTD